MPHCIAASYTVLASEQAGGISGLQSSGQACLRPVLAAGP